MIWVIFNCLIYSYLVKIIFKKYDREIIKNWEVCICDFLKIVLRKYMLYYDNLIWIIGFKYFFWVI